MYKPSNYLEVTYLPTYLPTYLLIWCSSFRIGYQGETDY
jgi:hypothetical protein